MNKYVWYASYGSNISYDRFMCYIKGGKPEGATKTYFGCADKISPIDQKPIKIPHELYFAKKSPTWDGGGVCFINPKKDVQVETLGNMYLITQEQFMEVVQQENGSKESMKIDFEKIETEKSFNISKAPYGNLLFLGRENNAPIFTFTNEKFLKNEINPPNVHYLKTIIKGLIQIHQLNQQALKTYLLSKKGVDMSIISNSLKSANF